MKAKFTSLALVCAFVLTLLVGCSSTATQALSATEYLELGYQYLTDLDYEAAIEAFEKAIEIDPQLVDGYAALALTYASQGELEKAEEILQQGIEATGDETLISLLESLDFIDITAQEIPALIQQTSQTDSEDLDSDALDPTILAEVDGTLTAFATFLDDANHDTSAIAQYMVTMGYAYFNTDLLDQLWQAGMPFQSPGDEGAQNVCVYTCETPGGTMALYQNGSLYYGDMVDGMRQGQGVWMDINVSDYTEDTKNTWIYYAICPWENDQPTGEAVYVLDVEILDNSGAVIESTYREKTGTLVNGLWNGAFVDTITSYTANPEPWLTATEVESYHYLMENGYSAPITYDGDQPIYCVDEDGVALDFPPDTTPQGIFGFALR